METGPGEQRDRGDVVRPDPRHEEPGVQTGIGPGDAERGGEQVPSDTAPSRIRRHRDPDLDAPVRLAVQPDLADGVIFRYPDEQTTRRRRESLRKPAAMRRRIDGLRMEPRGSRARIIRPLEEETGISRCGRPDPHQLSGASGNDRDERGEQILGRRSWVGALDLSEDVRRDARDEGSLVPRDDLE